MYDYQRLGDWLVSQGDLTAERLAHALSLQTQQRRRLGELLVELGYVREERVAEGLAGQYGLPLVDPNGFPRQKSALALLPAAVALERLVLMTHADLAQVCCVIADPVDIELTDALRHGFGRPLRMSLAPASALRRVILEAYGLEALVPATPAKKGRKRKFDTQEDRAELIARWSEEVA